MTSDRQSTSARTPAGDEAFDAHYYAHCCGKPYFRNEEWLQIFGGIADHIVSEIAPRRVLDAGCALGLLVESLRARGVEAFGIDLSTFAMRNVDESVRGFCRQGSVADELDADYDLIVSIEVLEHMPKAEAEAAIANFCRHTDDVLFSSSPSDHREATHVNVHPPEYWAEQFARHGFFRDVDFDASFVTTWAVRFRKERDLVHRVIPGYERRHYGLLLECNALRDSVIDLRRTLKELEVAQTELAQARDRIFHMERSFFWKLRRVWAFLSRQSG